ncbi:MAG: RNA methyltransferase PUA domain-containing protein, partial [Acidobacteriota bacterium]
MRRFFAPKETIVDGRVTLGPDESRHSREVLRLRQDDIAAVFDGEGNEYIGRVSAMSRSAVKIADLRPVEPA